MIDNFDLLDHNEEKVLVKRYPCNILHLLKILKEENHIVADTAEVLVVVHSLVMEMMVHTEQKLVAFLGGGIEIHKRVEEKPSFQSSYFDTLVEADNNYYYYFLQLLLHT